MPETHNGSWNAIDKKSKTSHELMKLITYFIFEGENGESSFGVTSPTAGNPNTT